MIYGLKIERRILKGNILCSDIEKQINVCCDPPNIKSYDHHVTNMQWSNSNHAGDFKLSAPPSLIHLLFCLFFAFYYILLFFFGKRNYHLQVSRRTSVFTETDRMLVTVNNVHL